MNEIILFGAGTIGRLIARQLIEKGTPPDLFADNDSSKWGKKVEGIPVRAPEDCRIFLPDACWIATVHRTPYRPEILADIERMGVKSISLYDFLPARVDFPPISAVDTVNRLIDDSTSRDYFADQLWFRLNPDLDQQLPPLDIANVYFEDFYTHLDDEHFVDCGAADGDTIRDFTHRWEMWGHITAFEPDPGNCASLFNSAGIPNLDIYNCAVGDNDGKVNFAALGDQTSHIIEGEGETQLRKLDSVLFPTPPTLIKMDIEGAELEGLWGARRIIRDHSPVLAICAYHHGPDLWKIPLLIHAFNPTYRFFFRRYLEATWELIWYAVPPERLR